MSHVLQASGLVQGRLTPLHLTPVQARLKPGYIETPFSFCFVRHPLSWLASLWCHEMEFGWSESDFAASTKSESFAGFLERVLSFSPTRPCSSHFLPFLEACDFIGRTESLATDLGRALESAQERFDPSVLKVEPLNETGLTSIKTAARAPRALLDEIMSSEQDFIRRFDYGAVPDGLVEDGPSRRLWPSLSLKDGADVGAVQEKQRLGLTRLTFDYRFDTGEQLDAQDVERRTQWALIGALRAATRKTSCAIIAESDPYFAFLAAELGWSEVTFVCSNQAFVSTPLRDMMSKPIEVIEYRQFFDDANSSARYDLVCLVDSLEMTPVVELELIAAASKLRARGTLIFCLLAMDVQNKLAIKTLWPSGTEAVPGRKVAYTTLSYVENLFAFLGFEQTEVCDSFHEAANDKLWPTVQSFAGDLAVEPGQLLRKTVVAASLGADDDCQNAAARDHLTSSWLARAPADLTLLPLDGLASSYRLTLATLQADVQAERRRREQAEQGLAERDAELVKVRGALAMTGIDADFHRAELLRARATADDWARRYEQLLSRIDLSDQSSASSQPA